MKSEEGTMATESWPKKVRTTIQPDEDVEVGQQEYDDLKALGLLVESGKTKTQGG